VTRPYHHGDLRRALLDAAEAILDRHGVAALTLRAAAREAGVSHAAPTHHFGDLTGLLTALAASGFVRLHARLLAELEVAGSDPRSRLTALGRGYVGFARACPGLFQLMFRSERLDWSSPELSTAGASAFALVTQDDELRAEGYSDGCQRFRSLAVAMARWSLVHGLATLLLDGRVEAMTIKVEGADVEQLVEMVLARLALE
jgi:AcrR family transcriptional regulator